MNIVNFLKMLLPPRCESIALAEALPPYEKLLGDLSGAYSRRINRQHRLVYQVLEDERVVKILRMWTHYE